MRLPGGRLLRPYAAGDQHGAGRQQVGDLRQRVGLAGDEERKRGLRPDQVRDVPHAGRVGPGGTIGQAQGSGSSPAAWSRS